MALICIFAAWSGVTDFPLRPVGSHTGEIFKERELAFSCFLSSRMAQDERGMMISVIKSFLQVLLQSSLRPTCLSTASYVHAARAVEQRRRAGRRLLALDPFGLRHRLPTRALTGLHSIGRRVVYPLLRSADESITANDFEVIDRAESIDDSTLVLVGTATAA